MPNATPNKTVLHKRERDIQRWWDRDPEGSVLARDRAPIGLRTPNGFVWGHKLDHIFWIPRVPNTNVITVWSRSMLKEHGEPGYDDKLWDEPLVKPRVVRPWPVLKLIKLKDGASGDDNNGATLNAVDRGCEHEHEHENKHAHADDDEDMQEDEALPSGWLAFFGECPDDPDELCTGPLIANAGRDRLKNARGEFYTYVWCEHFKAQINSVPDPQRMLTAAVAVVQQAGIRMIPDTVGLRVLVARDHWSDGVSSASAGTAEPASVDESSGKAEASTATQPATQTGDVTMSEESDAVTRESTSGPAEDTGNAESSTAEGGKQQDTAPRDLFSTSDLPKLEEFIPKKYFPDTLMVHDPDRTTRPYGRVSTRTEPFVYKRFYPKFSSEDEQEGSDEGGKETDSDKEDEQEDSDGERVAHLYLSKQNRFGAGNHSYVYRAPLTLPPPLSARSPTGQVTVAAKLAYNRCTAHALLQNEARVYKGLPEDMQEEWCGYNLVPQCRFPVPVAPIAPKFFGYYAPVDENTGRPVTRSHSSCSEDHPCTVEWPSPILLMEECGNPVDPAKFTADQRTECFSLLLRLHHNDIVQGSFYVRNIMIQPGPLSRPPEERSFDTPSFRIIDFGRGRFWDWELEQGDIHLRKNARYEFAQRIGDEVYQAREQLMVQEMAF